METRAHHVLIGSFVLMVLIGFVAFIWWAVESDGDVQYKKYTIYFDTAVTGLSRAAVVRLNGIPVGDVTDIQFDDKTGTRVNVTIRVDESAPINSSSTASLEAQLLTGVSSVQINNVNDDPSKPVRPLKKLKGEKYPIIPTQVTGFQNVVASAPEVIEAAIRVLDQANKLLSDDNIEVFSGVLSDVRTVTSSVASRSDDIAETITGVRNSVDRAESILATIDQTAKEDLPLIVDDVRAAVANIEEMTANLNAAVEENREPIRNFTQATLPELSQFVVDARRLAASLRRVVEQLEESPSNFIFSPKDPQVEAPKE